MNADELLHALEYDRAAGFVPRARLAESVDQAHVFRRAINACHLGGGELHGVYQLQQSQDAGGATSVVYVAEAPSVDEADKLHRLIWNQAAVPFVLVRLPTGIRLYSGFRYASKPRSGKVRGPREGVLAASVAFGKCSLPRNSTASAPRSIVRSPLESPTLRRHLRREEKGRWNARQRGGAAAPPRCLVSAALGPTRSR